MAHSKQAQKRIRQNERNRLANKARMSRMKTEIKAVLAAVAAGDRTKAAAMATRACAAIDKAAKLDVIHANNAARHKSQVMRAVAAMQ